MICLDQSRIRISSILNGISLNVVFFMRTMGAPPLALMTEVWYYIMYDTCICVPGFACCVTAQTFL